METCCVVITNITPTSPDEGAGSPVIGNIYEDMPSKLLDEIAYPFPNFYSCTIVVRG